MPALQPKQAPPNPFLLVCPQTQPWNLAPGVAESPGPSTSGERSGHQRGEGSGKAVGRQTHSPGVE